MIPSSVRSAGLALLLTMSGCGGLDQPGTGARTPSLNVAQAALEGGSGEIALQVSEGVLREQPNSTHAMEIKGDALTLLGDYDGAAAIFQALLAKDPNSIRANIGLGRIRLAKDPAAAEALFQQVLKRDPKETTALNNLGIARDLQGHHAEAQVAYRQALGVDPDLESAQVNLALSMAMSGHGPEAVRMLQARAAQPGAAVKVRHDYAVVLAMAGNRPEAERVLSNDLSPDEARQVLDSVTGTHTRIVRDGTAFAARQSDDCIPPDVVQVPEAAVTPSRPAAIRATVAAATSSAPATPAQRGTAAQGAALAAPPPMVVRPRSVAEPESGSPVLQPVSPVAAAVVNQRSLALPIQGPPPGAASNGARTRTADAVTNQAIATPEVVALPRPTQRLASAAETARPEAARTEAGHPTLSSPAIVPAVAPAVMAAAIPARPVPEASQKVTPRASGRHEGEDASAAQTRMAVRDDGSPMVQFAAAASEEAAHSFWRVLVHRFPDALGQREPVVIRFERGGTVFWRVRTEGFGSTSEAQTLCARVHAGGQDCFVPRS
jgi:Flp pilus assembly protein TadD